MAFQVTEVQKALKGADYPMDGKALSDLAKKNGAEQELVDALSGLRQVDGPNGVMKELKGELGGPTPGGNDKDKPREYKDVEGPAWQVNEVQKYLKGADYPMDGKALSDLAKKNGAEQELVDALRELPEVNGPNKVQSELKAHLGGKPGDA
jgi:ribosomal protein L20